MRFLLFTLVLFWMPLLASSQQRQLDSLYELHSINDFSKSKSFIESFDKELLSDYQILQLEYETCRYLLNTGDEPVKVYERLQRLKKKIPQDSLDFLFRVNDELIYLGAVSTNRVDLGGLRDQNCAIAEKTQDPRQLLYCDYYKMAGLNFELPKDYKKAVKILHHSAHIAEQNGMDDNLYSLKYNLAAVHDLGQSNESTLPGEETIDSAFYYYKQVLPYYEKNRSKSIDLVNLYNNIGKTHYRDKKLDSAAFYFLKSESLNMSIGQNNSDLTILQNLAELYLEQGNYQLSAERYKKLVKAMDSIKNLEINSSIIELETKYQSAEKDLKILKQEAKNQQQENWLISLAALTLLLILATIFIFKNQNKKRQLALQEKQLAQERADNLFKEQELATIDAMIAGQEKERSRLSEDLHDNLGSNLTTLKLYVENLKESVNGTKEQEILERSEKILSHTYENIRRLSHARHNGLLTSQGLIPAIKELADRINQTRKIHIEVLSYGLDQTLENSTELMIFRVVQELTTNIVKHANATEASINVTSHENHLNIMVEDNGKGFKSNPLPRSEGMGLSSIEKRVENQGGTFHVDSSPGNGTTITLDISLS